MIDFFYNTEGFSLEREELIMSILQDIAVDYKLIIDYINIVFVNDEELLEMNKRFLSHDYYTDIITFNYSAKPGLLEAELYISIDRVKDNAIQNDVSLQDEISRIIIHGMLHLSGFEDSTVLEKQKMTARENHYLTMIPFHVKRSEI